MFSIYIVGVLVCWLAIRLAKAGLTISLSSVHGGASCLRAGPAAGESG